MAALIQVCVSVIDMNGNEKEAQRGEVGEVDELGNRDRERERETYRGAECSFIDYLLLLLDNFRFLFVCFQRNCSSTMMRF